MPLHTKKQFGTTLIEMLLSISLLIIISSFALPQLVQLKAYFESRATQKSLLTFVASARARALYRQEIITLCPIAEGSTCSTDWNQPISIFVDSNANAILDSEEALISTWNEKNNLANLYWIVGRRYIRFRPNGSTTETTGSLKYCVAYSQNRYSFRLVIARTGRTRIDRKEHKC